jgi:cytidylate kinase
MEAEKAIITIGREYGSGGREIGSRLAKKIGVPFYDKELLTRAAKASGICEELFENHDEKAVPSYLFSFLPGADVVTSGGEAEMPLNHRIFLAQFEAIAKIALEGPCVMVGRCANYVLTAQPNLVSIFMYADVAARVERIMQVENLPYDQAKERVRKVDKQRQATTTSSPTATGPPQQLPPDDQHRRHGAGRRSGQHNRLHPRARVTLRPFPRVRFSSPQKTDEARSLLRRFRASRLLKNPGRRRRVATRRLHCETSDMRGGFAGLAQQGYTAPFPARERSEQGRGASSIKWLRHFIDRLARSLLRRFRVSLSGEPCLSRPGTILPARCAAPRC